MRPVIFAGILTLVLASSVVAKEKNPYDINRAFGTGSNPNSHRVDGHIRRDGTYVAPHVRTDPNHRVQDNYSTQPNYNPYTGTTGTRTYDDFNSSSRRHSK